MKPEEILVSHKISTYEYLCTRGPEALERYMEDDDVSLEELKENDEFHRDTFEKVKALFKGSNIVWRGKVDAELISNFNYVVTLGGDGTVLDASHYIFDDTPIFAINSTKGARYSSEGIYCGASRLDLEEKVGLLFSGDLDELKLNRLEVYVDGKRTNELVTNEICVAHIDPFAMSRYRIKVGDYEEKQRSSGIMVCTAMGSTAFMGSIGGDVMPIRSTDMQYKARDVPLGRTNQYRLVQGFTSEPVQVTSNMREGVVGVDGKHIKYNLPLGSKVVVQSSDKPLTILGFDEENRRKYYES